MSEEKEDTRRYVGKFFVDTWKHRKTGKPCKRVKITFPTEILDNKNFRLRTDRGVLVTVDKSGKVTLEPL